MRLGFDRKNQIWILQLEETIKPVCKGCNRPLKIEEENIVFCDEQKIFYCLTCEYNTNWLIKCKVSKNDLHEHKLIKKLEVLKNG